MNDMTLLKNSYDEAPPRHNVRQAARARLLREITEPPPRPAPRAALRLTLLKVAAGAGATALAITAGSVAFLVYDNAPAQSPLEAAHGPAVPSTVVNSASRVLHLAANRARIVSAETKEPRANQFFYAKQTWTRTRSDGGKPTVQVNEYWVSVDGSKPSLYRNGQTEATVPPYGEVNGMKQLWPPVDWADLKKLPTDSAELLHTLRNMHGVYDPTKTTEPYQDPAYMYLTTLLNASVVLPGDLRAAAFDALASLPGADLTEGSVSIGKRSGIGITTPVNRDVIVVDATTYDYLGRLDPGYEYSDGKTQWVGATTTLDATGVVDEIGQRP